MSVICETLTDDFPSRFMSLKYITQYPSFIFP